MNDVIDYSQDLSKLSLAQLMSLRDLAHANRVRLQREVGECADYEYEIRTAIFRKELESETGKK